MKCLVRDCPNTSDQGTFIGGLCAPCHGVIVEGKRPSSFMIERLFPELLKWRPIVSAPFGREVMVRGNSGYSTPHNLFITNAYRERDWHRGEWNDATGDRLSDNGWEPTEWREIW